MKLTIVINLDNEAFSSTATPAMASGCEVASIIHKFVKRVDGQPLGAGDNFWLMDSNGNRVGYAKVTGRRA